jgi:hypothetical protein
MFEERKHNKGYCYTAAKSEKVERRDIEFVCVCLPGGPLAT